MKKVLFTLIIVCIGIQMNAQTDSVKAKVVTTVYSMPSEQNPKVVTIMCAPRIQAQEVNMHQQQPQVIQQRTVVQSQPAQKNGVIISREQYEEYLYLRAKEGAVIQRQYQQGINNGFIPNNAPF